MEVRSGGKPAVSSAFSIADMPAKSPKLSIYADDDLKRDLKILAEHEQRSVSQMANILLKEAVKARLDHLRQEEKI
jgi:hypothetical protein